MVVRFNKEGTFFLKLNVKGVEANCKKCGVHIHTGTTCKNASLVGPHYWNLQTFGTKDPWNDFGFYNSNKTGMTKTAFAGNSGYDYVKNLGRAAVIHSAVSSIVC